MRSTSSPGCAPPTGSATPPSTCTPWPASSPKPSNSCPRPSMTPATRNSPGPRSANYSAPPPPQQHAATGTSHDQLDKDHVHNAAVRLSSAGLSSSNGFGRRGGLSGDAQRDPAVSAVVPDQCEPQGQQGINGGAGTGVTGEERLQSHRGDEFLGGRARAGIGGEEHRGTCGRVGE